MKVFRIGNSEVEIIEQALDTRMALYNDLMKKARNEQVRQCIEYDQAHIRTTKALLKDQCLQELCEKCLSFFWDRLSMEGTDNPDVEWLADEIGISEDELVALFREAGYNE